MRSSSKTRGFTLIEVLLASTILAAAVLALAQAITAGQAQTYDALHRARAQTLLESMLEEVLVLPVIDPDGDTTFGPESGEIRGSGFDAIDDYHGHGEESGALTDIAGVLLPQAYQRFKRDVTVTSETLDAGGLGEYQGLRVTVTVSEANGREWSLERFVPAPPDPGSSAGGG